MDKEIKEALKIIFSGIEKLKNKYPHRKFTIDGRLVGDIGEVIAGRDYQIKLDETSQPNRDGICEDTKLEVQIKTTFQEKLTFKTVPDLYLGLKLSKDGEPEEIYNGPGINIFNHFEDRKDIGEKLLSFPIETLRELSEKVDDKDKIKKRE